MKEPIFSEHAPSPIGPYHQGIKAGGWLFISGQIGLDPDTGNFVSQHVGEQASRALQSIGAILHKADMDISHIVKCSIFLRDMNDFAVVNTQYATFFEDRIAPARETVAVNGLPKDALVEISAIAYKEGLKH